MVGSGIWSYTGLAFVSLVSHAADFLLCIFFVTDEYIELAWIAAVLTIHPQHYAQCHMHYFGHLLKLMCFTGWPKSTIFLNF